MKIHISLALVLFSLSFLPILQSLSLTGLKHYSSQTLRRLFPRLQRPLDNRLKDLTLLTDAAQDMQISSPWVNLFYSRTPSRTFSLMTNILKHPKRLNILNILLSYTHSLSPTHTHFTSSPNYLERTKVHLVICMETA